MTQARAYTRTPYKNAHETDQNVMATIGRWIGDNHLSVIGISTLKLGERRPENSILYKKASYNRTQSSW